MAVHLYLVYIVSAKSISMAYRIVDKRMKNTAPLFACSETQQVMSVGTSLFLRLVSFLTRSFQVFAKIIVF